jgi:hypothetical protein
MTSIVFSSLFQSVGTVQGELPAVVMNFRQVCRLLIVTVVEPNPEDVTVSVGLMGVGLGEGNGEG